MSIGRKSLRWKKDVLYYGTKIVGKVIPDEKIPKMYYAYWKLPSEYNPPTEILGAKTSAMSADYYNKTRAKEHTMRVALKFLNHGEEVEPEGGDLKREETG